MKVYTKVVWDSDGIEILADFYAYEGPIARLGGGSSKSSQNSIAQTSTGPWSAQQPYLTQGFSDALKNYQSDKPQYYPDSTVVPFSQTTQQGMGLMAGLAHSRLPQSAANQAQSTINGDYLGNPGSALGVNPAAFALNPFAYVSARVHANPNANVSADVASNPDAAIRAGTSVNPYLNATSSLATNDNINASNPNVGQINPYAGVRADTPYNANTNAFNPYANVSNPYLAQGMNDYIGNVTNAVSRSVIPQVTSQFAAAGRGGDSPIAQQAIAKGIADAVSPYQFNSAEAEMGRRFQGGESQANRLYGAGATLAGQQYNSGADYASRAQNASENQAGRLFGAGTDYISQLYNSGEALAGRQFAGGEAQAARAQGIADALAQRQYAGGESYANRDQAAADAAAGRQFSAGESLAGAQRAAAADKASRQFTAGGALAAGLNQSAADRAARQFSAGSDLTSRAYGAGESALTRGLSNYTSERANQLNQVNNAGATYSNEQAPAQTLLNLGNMEEQKSGENLSDLINRFNFDQNLPQQKLNDYMAQISGNYGQAGTNVTNATGTSSYQQPFAQTFGQIGQGIGGMFGGFGGKAPGAGK